LKGVGETVSWAHVSAPMRGSFGPHFWQRSRPMNRRKRSITHTVSRILFFWPAAGAVALGRGLISLSETVPGRVLLRPLFQVVARFVLCARSLPIVRPTKQQSIPTGALQELLASQGEIAVISCACRATVRRCTHPLHGPHESETCLSFGLVATLQRMSGLGRKLSLDEAQRLCDQAAASGMVHHGILSFGRLAEVCNCCSDSCTVFAACRRGLTRAVRPSGLTPTRTDPCDGCQGRSGRLCVEICPYAQGPGSDGCVGCGLCAYHCARQAIHMVEAASA